MFRTFLNCLKILRNLNFCQTPVLGLGLGVDFTFAWDNNNKNNKKKKKNPHLDFLQRNSARN